MTHPDLLFTMRQLQHQNLLAKMEWARAGREPATARVAGDLTLSAWLKRLAARWVRSFAPAAMQENSTAV